MMFKKLIGIVLALAMIVICEIPVFAETDDSAANIAERNNTLINRLLRSTDAKNNDNGIVDIKRPEDAIITTFKESYTISGETSGKNVKVFLAKYDEDNDAYVPFENSDGESSWRIGGYGKFAKGIVLSKGANKLKLVAVKNYNYELLTADDIQISRFTITFFEKSLADRLIQGVQDGISDFRNALDSLITQ